jgi:peptidoglycan/LPS O-acetylase OafA/YrhL
MDPGPQGRGWQYGLIGGAKYWMQHFSVFGMYAHFAVGVLAGGWVAWRERQHAGEGVWHRPTHPFYDVAAAGALAGAAAVIWITRRGPEFGFSIGSQPFAFPAFALLVALAVGALPFSVVLGRLLDNRYARYTSGISFGLYLWNELVFDLFRRLHHSFHHGGMHSVGPWLAVSLAAFASVYAVAHLSHAWIERPFLEEAGRWRALLRDGLRHARRCMAAATASLPFAGATRATSGRGFD